MTADAMEAIGNERRMNVILSFHHIQAGSSTQNDQTSRHIARTQIGVQLRTQVFIIPNTIRRGVIKFLSQADVPNASAAPV
jgi:hypothetical protein